MPKTIKYNWNWMLLLALSKHEYKQVPTHFSWSHTSQINIKLNIVHTWLIESKNTLSFANNWQNTQIAAKLNHYYDKNGAMPWGKMFYWIYVVFIKKKFIIKIKLFRQLRKTMWIKEIHLPFTCTNLLFVCAKAPYTITHLAVEQFASNPNSPTG